ncbi:MAG: FKBP-type peptidyl-prolyl cis-trans isomerase [Pseudomonadota bacterium]|nr:FKBP-type peptidyl-prolyl cis-trans isomerase [Pseudomonadota bacterium]
MKRSLVSGAALAAILLAGTTTVQADSSTQSQKVAALNELQTIDTVVGTGAEASAGHVVNVHYTGWLYDESAKDHKGRKFDSSVDRGQPFNFPLGGGRVIRGWDQGVAGMKVGGKRTLVIPAELGYGARGAGGVIPPNATLVFDVELLGVN